MTASRLSESNDPHIPENEVPALPVEAREELDPIESIFQSLEKALENNEPIELACVVAWANDKTLHHDIRELAYTHLFRFVPVTQLKTLDVDFSCRWYGGGSVALAVAIKLGNEDIIKWLIQEKNFSITECNRKGEGALFHAVTGGQKELFKKLLTPLEAGGYGLQFNNVNDRDPYQWRLLTAIKDKNDKEYVTIILSKRFEPLFSENNITVNTVALVTGDFSKGFLEDSMFDFLRTLIKQIMDGKTTALPGEQWLTMIREVMNNPPRGAYFAGDVAVADAYMMKNNFYQAAIYYSSAADAVGYGFGYPDNSCIARKAIANLLLDGKLLNNGNIQSKWDGSNDIKQHAILAAQYVFIPFISYHQLDNALYEKLNGILSESSSYWSLPSLYQYTCLHAENEEMFDKVDIYKQSLLAQKEGWWAFVKSLLDAPETKLSDVGVFLERINKVCPDEASHLFTQVELYSKKENTRLPTTHSTLFSGHNQAALPIKIPEKTPPNGCDERDACENRRRQKACCQLL